MKVTYIHPANYLYGNMVWSKAQFHTGQKKVKYFKSLKGKRVKTDTQEKLDSVMYKSLKTGSDRNIPITCNIFKEKALDFAKSLDFHDFHASNGWLG